MTGLGKVCLLACCGVLVKGLLMGAIRDKVGILGERCEPEEGQEIERLAGKGWDCGVGGVGMKMGIGLLRRERIRTSLKEFNKVKPLMSAVVTGRFVPIIAHYP